MKLVTVAEMQSIEREADARGWTYAAMMDKAGRGLAEAVQANFGYSDRLFALALVGSGNNGGDALVALAELALVGWQTAAYLVRAREKDDPLIARAREAGCLIGAVDEDGRFSLLDGWLEEASVLLDGILGTGVKLPLRGAIASVLSHVRASAFCPPVVAVDCPSGVDCDLGRAALEVLPAELTVCMAAVKAGLLQFPACEYTGEIQVVSIGLPDGLESWLRVQREVIEDEYVRGVLPARRADGHKGSFGTVVVAAGSANFPGAALLAGKAALRVGPGLVTLAVPATTQAALVGHIPEATWLPLSQQAGNLSGIGASELRAGLTSADALLFGSGFGVAESTADFVHGLVSSPGLPALVVDADGLKLLARVPAWAEKLPAESVLTPHPGEMAVLTGLPVSEIQADRAGIAARFAREWGHVVVLKGAFTVVAGPDGRIGVIPVATSALAHAGTGDVLAGIIAGLRAQRMNVFEAAAAGAWLHARAGLAAEERLGHAACVTAGEVITSLPEVIASVWER
jgi:NAD(P)H-hydrate epimerase